jgi:hypothetical protein
MVIAWLASSGGSSLHGDEHPAVSTGLFSPPLLLSPSAGEIELRFAARVCVIGVAYSVDVSIDYRSTCWNARSQTTEIYRQTVSVDFLPIDLDLVTIAFPLQPLAEDDCILIN